MVRAAAKNHDSRDRDCVDPLDYGAVLAELRGQRVGHGRCGNAPAFSPPRRSRTRRSYDAAGGLPYLDSQVRAARRPSFPRDGSALHWPGSAWICATARIRTSSAAFYLVSAQPHGASVGTASQLQGKDLSYNNIADADTAFECVRQFDQPACVIVKHANPCGVAVAGTLLARVRPRVPHGPDVGVWWHHRLQPRGRCRHRERTARAPVRGSAGGAGPAEYRSARCLRAQGQRARARPRALPGPWDGGSRAAQRSTGGLLAQTRDVANVWRGEDLQVVTRRRRAEPSAAR